jgi:nitrous oxidase accessory protein
MEWQVQPGKGTLQSAIDAASSGDSLLLVAGTYTGSIEVNRSLTLSGSTDGVSLIDGEGSSHVVLVTAPDVVIRGLDIRHSGDVAEDENSGIFITAEADRTRIEGNHLEGNLIGVYLKGPHDAVVSNNMIVGSKFHRMNGRGNGVYLWDTPGSEIRDNVIRYGRDGIFVNGSRDNVFSGNHMSDLRFAIHYMYAHDS